MVIIITKAEQLSKNAGVLPGGGVEGGGVWNIILICKSFFFSHYNSFLSQISVVVVLPFTYIADIMWTSVKPELF